MKKIMVKVVLECPLIFTYYIGSCVKCECLGKMFKILSQWKPEILTKKGLKVPVFPE